MSGDLYRDAHVGIRAHIAELEIRIAEREAEVTTEFWRSLPLGVQQRLAVMRGRSSELANADSLEALARAEALLSAYIEELDRLIATLPSMEAAWAEVPDDVGVPSSVPVLFGLPTREEAAVVLRSFAAMVRERARDAEVTGESPSFVARFRERGCPFALRATLHTTGNGVVAEVSNTLVTSIARALPPLVVRHETLVLSVGKALGLKHEVEVGEPSFDGLFLIDGTKEAAAFYLSPAVRANLLALSRFDVPTLDVDPQSRTASLQWRFEPAPKALEAAVRVLTAVRESRPSLRFRSDD